MRPSIANTSLRVEKPKQLNQLLSFIERMTDIQTQSLIPNAQVLEIGVSTLLKNENFSAGVEFEGFPAPDADLICSETHLPFAAAFDCVISPLSLHFSKSPKTHLAQLISILKPGGRLILTALGHYSLHEVRTFLQQDSQLNLLDFIHPAQLKSWLPPQGQREVTETWATLNYHSLYDLMDELKELKISPFQLTNENLCHESLKSFQSPLTFQIIMLTYQKPQITRDE